MPTHEDFLFYVWRHKVFNQQDIKTVDGQHLEIIENGILNTDAGPDFQGARIRVGDTEWAGNVEIHVRASDWRRHSHSSDKAYNNVILHVVHEYDQPAYRNDGTEIPVFQIGPHIHAGTEKNYKSLVENLNWIPCEKHLGSVDDLHLQSWLLRMLIERLENKSEEFFHTLHEYKGSWDDAFYISLARNFGFKKNALPFEMLARSLPQQILAKHKNNALQIEALIFGQAGFLQNDFEDDYHRGLSQEDRYLRAKYHLQPIDRSLWKFLRLRPQNFPTLRLAQFSALVFKSSHLFSKILDLKDCSALREVFKALPVNSYWSKHYRFGKVAGSVNVQLGTSSINNLLLNSVAVTLFSFGKYTNSDEIKDRAIQLLEDLPFEANEITRKFVASGIKMGRSDRSQALLHLKKSYCDLKKCLNCAIGTKIVNPK